MRATRSALSSAVQKVMDGPSWASAGGARSATRSGTATNADMERRAMDGLLRRSVTKARGPGSTLAARGSGFQSAAHIAGEGGRRGPVARPILRVSSVGGVAAFQEGGAAIKLGVFDPIFGSLALPEMLDPSSSWAWRRWSWAAEATRATGIAVPRSCSPTAPRESGSSARSRSVDSSSVRFPATPTPCIPTAQRLSSRTPSSATPSVWRQSSASAWSTASRVVPAMAPTPRGRTG